MAPRPTGRRRPAAVRTRLVTHTRPAVASSAWTTDASSSDAVRDVARHGVVPHQPWRHATHPDPTGGGDREVVARAGGDRLAAGVGHAGRDRQPVVTDLSRGGGRHRGRGRGRRRRILRGAPAMSPAVEHAASSSAVGEREGHAHIVILTSPWGAGDAGTMHQAFPLGLELSLTMNPRGSRRRRTDLRRDLRRRAPRQDVPGHARALHVLPAPAGVDRRRPRVHGADDRGGGPARPRRVAPPGTSCRVARAGRCPWSGR